MYSRPGEYRKICLANYLCIGFVPGGTVGVAYMSQARRRRAQILTFETGDSELGWGGVGSQKNFVPSLEDQGKLPCHWDDPGILPG